MDKETNIEDNKRKGVLFVVSTPIGNDDDITLRALKVLRASEIIICEEGKVGGRFLHKYNISQKMELLNENNEIDKTFELLQLLKDGSKLSLVSDCGTPVFADPGLLLIQKAIENDIDVVVVPGASSIMTAVVRSTFPLHSFIYAGFLSREKSERVNQITLLAKEPRTVVLLETPYRLMPVLEAFLKIIPKRMAYIGCNLTMPFETHHYGTFSELYNKFSENKFKGEFVIVFQGNPEVSDILIPSADYMENRFSRDREFPKSNKDSRSRPDRERRDGDRPRFDRDGDKPRFNREGGDRPRFDSDGDKPRFNREGGDRPRFDRDGDKPRFNREGGDRPRFDRDGDKPRFSRDGGGSKFSKSDRPKKFDKNNKRDNFKRK